MEFQNLLILAGCLKSKADGVWGPQTEAAYLECKKKESLSVKLRITYYCPCKICCGQQATGTCADGTPFATGVLAAPASIPFGSTVEFAIEGKQYSNTVHDRGGAIKVEGDFCKIDYGMESHDECKQRGVDTVDGTIKLKWENCDGM